MVAKVFAGKHAPYLNVRVITRGKKTNWIVDLFFWIFACQFNYELYTIYVYLFTYQLWEEIVLAYWIIGNY